VDADLTILLEEPQSPGAIPPEISRASGIALDVKSVREPLAGLQDCASDYLLWIESGAQLDAELLYKIWSKRGDAEVVLASRYVRGGAARLPAAASFLQRRTNRFLRRALRLPCYDPTSGIRLYARAALDELPSGIRARLQPLETLVHLENLGFRIREVPHRSIERRGYRWVLRELWQSLAALPRLRRLRNSPDAADADDRGFASRLPWRRRRLARRQQTIVGYLEVDVPVLDVGCGSGRLVQTVSKAVGLDKDLRKLRFLRGRARATVAGELTRLPFRDGSFPQVVCADVVSSLAPEVSYLPELRRILRPFGTLVLAKPAGSRSGEADLRSELETNGFAVDEMRRVDSREILVRALRRETAEPT
jgi:SAM-dependent methyltransferase